MNASDPANSNKLTDEQLDALLESADQELLLHIQATTDPTATLTKLLACPMSLEDGRADPTHADSATRPGHLTYGQRTRSHRRPWQAIRVAAAAVAVAGAAMVIISIAVAHAIHHPANPVSVRHLPVPASGMSPPSAGTLNKTAFDLPFNSGQSRLSRSAVGQLSMLLTVRSSTSGIAAITITGFAEDRRDPARAVKLSAMRVQAVRNWFLAHHVPACALHTVHPSAAMARDRANVIGRNVVVVTIRVTMNSSHAAQNTNLYYSCEQLASNY
jgi:outer membrane protein OmpA-like peptidoglycan-associated protein